MNQSKTVHPIVAEADVDRERTRQWMIRLAELLKDADTIEWIDFLTVTNAMSLADLIVHTIVENGVAQGIIKSNAPTRKKKSDNESAPTHCSTCHNELQPRDHGLCVCMFCRGAS